MATGTYRAGHGLHQRLADELQAAPTHCATPARTRRWRPSNGPCWPTATGATPDAISPPLAPSGLPRPSARPSCTA
jgi:hypothetical protein